MTRQTSFVRAEKSATLSLSEPVEADLDSGCPGSQSACCQRQGALQYGEEIVMARHQERTGPKRTRITIDVTADLRRRIKIAAAERDVSVREYVVDVLEHALSDGRAQGPTRGTPVTDETIDRLAQIRESIMRGRTFADDTTDLINEGREERMADL
jgi:hypothetical protein